MDVVFYLHAPENLTAAREPPGPSKYEAKTAHVGEGLGLFVFSVSVAAYDSSTFFRNVRARHQFTSQKKESENGNENSRLSNSYPSICIG